MRKSVFTTADVDNINELCQIDPESQSGQKKIALLDSYTIVLPIEIQNIDSYLAPSDDRCFPGSTFVPRALVKDEASLKHAFGLINKETLATGEMYSLAGFNASQIKRETVRPRAEIGICPIFVDKVQSPCMLKHAMIYDGIGFLSPDQTPVIRAHQPLYSILKQLQLQFPESELAEDSFFCDDGGTPH